MADAEAVIADTGVADADAETVFAEAVVANDEAILEDPDAKMVTHAIASVNAGNGDK